MTESVVVEEVELFYGEMRATQPLSFTAHEGELLSIVGASGCGKSSALRAIGGLLAPQSGQVRINGTPVSGTRPDEVAFLFQHLALYPWRSALRNVEIGLEFAGVPRGERRARAEAALETVGLADFADQHPSQLSGGMRQRVALARALASDAKILLFDEPFAALDEQSRLRLGMEVLSVLEAERKTVIFVTHSLAEAAYLSDRIVVMTPRPGGIAEILDVDLPHPRHPDMMRSPEFHAITDRLTELLFADKAAA
jgi:NitT/TauT family transport system ATP-binding protein